LARYTKPNKRFPKKNLKNIENPRWPGGGTNYWFFGVFGRVYSRYQKVQNFRKTYTTTFAKSERKKLKSQKLGMVGEIEKNALFYLFLNSFECVS